MGNNVVKDVKRNVKNCIKALRFLEGLTAFTYKEYVKSLKLAGEKTTESDNLEIWKKMTAKSESGSEPLRQTLITLLQLSVNNLERNANVTWRLKKLLSVE